MLALCTLTPLCFSFLSSLLAHFSSCSLDLVGFVTLDVVALFLFSGGMRKLMGRLNFFLDYLAQRSALVGTVVRIVVGAVVGAVVTALNIAIIFFFLPDEVLVLGFFAIFAFSLHKS